MDAIEPQPEPFLEPPPSTQTRFHPDFDQEVTLVCFSVDGQGFKTDSARLTAHSEFLRTMLHESRDIGVTREGSAEHPIIVQGCTKETFANFMGWLNHNPWEDIEADHVKQLLDVLDVCHMWSIRPGFDFALGQLKTRFSLRPSHKIFLAQRYKISGWIPDAVRSLLQTPFIDYTEDDVKYLSIPAYMVIACAKEEILATRKLMAAVTPYPAIFGADAPHCVHHNTCTRVWFDKWLKEIVRRIHHPSQYFPLIKCITTLAETNHEGMSPDCKRYVLEWMHRSCLGIGKEEAIVWKTIEQFQEMFDVKD